MSRDFRPATFPDSEKPPVKGRGASTQLDAPASDDDPPGSVRDLPPRGARISRHGSRKWRRGYSNGSRR